MIRMTVWTAIGLTVLYLTFGAVFADHTNVAWKDCRLAEREVVLTLENNGGEVWSRFTVGSRVFRDGRLVASTNPARSEELAPGVSRTLRLGLPKALEAGKTYTVAAHIQRGRSPVVSCSWERTPEVQMTRLSAILDPFSGPIPPIHPMLGINVKKEMGLDEFPRKRNLALKEKKSHGSERKGDAEPGKPIDEEMMVSVF